MGTTYIRPHFICFKSDFVLAPRSGRRVFSIDQTSSVAKLKEHLYECMRSLGDVTFVEGSSRHELETFFRRPDHLFIMVHGGDFPPFWNTIPKRTVQHSLGNFLIPEYFYHNLLLPHNVIHLVTTQFQSRQLKKFLGQAGPQTAVFAPRLDEDMFFPPTPRERRTARQRFGLGEKDIHFVYAGRWLADKGICQLLRSVQLWPQENLRMTLAGNFDPHARLPHMNETHRLFSGYVERNFLRSGKQKGLRLLRAHRGKRLRELYWSADVFVYPSVHADENFGLAPREAALCGLPVVTTDFCGLHPLASVAVQKGLATYPTVTGPRYSVYQLRRLIALAAENARERGRLCRSAVIKECDPVVSKMNLEKAIARLVREPLMPLPAGSSAETQLKVRLLRYAHEDIASALLHHSKRVPSGGLVRGLEKTDRRFAFYALFLAIQGMYTTSTESPTVEKGNTYRGFYPLALRPEQKELVESGFPGPRVRKCSTGEWKSLLSCVKVAPGGEMTLCPRREGEVSLAQELVDLGYIVPDSYSA